VCKKFEQDSRNGHVVKTVNFIPAGALNRREFVQFVAINSR
jgi:hypothetical protein